ncbi:MAG: carbamoyltransferase HypF [Deltaproteobacteria bacterium]|nr:carbamoyltransferase HypF [Deltaproteobacteria bacterium]
MIEAKVFEISGIVQGVGFRPFIYRLAKQYFLSGEVSNTEAGVCVKIEGEKENIDRFYKDIAQKKPPLSLITNVSIFPAEIKGFKNFLIAESTNKNKNSKTALIPQDVSICSDCLTELLNPQNRRYKYPFINCTNCGPRYTIIKDVPYDRRFTTMKPFKMCDSCFAEYQNPEDRRFHAEPNACHVCGPNVLLFDNRKKPIKTQDPIAECANLIKKGYIVAVKGIGGFHFVADAQNNKAVFTLREKKKRPDKPFALMSRDIEDIEKFARINNDEKNLIESLARPIVLLKKKQTDLLSEHIAPNNNYFGVMLPYTPLHYLLFERQNFTVLIMTSANISGEPIISDNNKAFEKLSGVADFFLIHDRKIHIQCDDSILKKNQYNLETIRRSRGFAPSPIFLNKKTALILACGAELKNTICITKKNKAFVSQYIGDLKSFAAYKLFEKTISHLKKITDVKPQIIAFDKHPDYLSSRYAKALKNAELIGVWHHHAHIISCIAENKTDEPVIGIALDGTGLGTDNNIWGGEIIIATPASFTRKAHLSYAAMPGADAATKEPWRMGISYLYGAYGEDFLNCNIDFLKNIDPQKIRIIAEMIQKKINSPLTSSAGRLFDGVCAILGLKNKITFEAQAAMELENIANPKITDFYKCERIKKEVCQIPFAPIIKGIVSDLRQKIPVSDISAKFHNTIIKIFAELCIEIKKETKINKVALSGGVFHNSIISNGLISRLKNAKFEVLTHKQLPANDGGISLGQAVIAAAVMKKK